MPYIRLPSAGGNTSRIIVCYAIAHLMGYEANIDILNLFSDRLCYPPN